MAKQSKADIRRAAKQGLDALLAAVSATDESEQERHLREGLAHLNAAAGTAPEDVKLGKSKPKDDDDDPSLREAMAYAYGETNDNPRARGDLLDQVVGKDNADVFRGEGS